MKIGYPCINRSINCTANHTFRLASYSEDKLELTVASNLACLKKILEYNKDNGLMFLRISSDIVPFASHPVCTFNWRERFAGTFREIGQYIRSNGFRISMHPDQFVLLNSNRQDVVRKSIAELEYHEQVLRSMELGPAARIQIHVGGLYNDRPGAIDRFVKVFGELRPALRSRISIENDDRLFPLADCMTIHQRTGIPVIFDNFHHECLNRGEKMRDAVLMAAKTWTRENGPLMIDYSEQDKGARKGKHTASISPSRFKKFITLLDGINADIMLEIKDKEKSALKALKILQNTVGEER